MIVQSFIHYLTFEKRYSEHTITAYRADIAQFQDFLSSTYEVHDVLEARSAYIRSWVVQMMQQGIEVRSIQRKRSVLNSLFKFAIRQESLEVNPMEQVSMPKVKKTLPKYLRPNEMERLDLVLPEMTSYETARDSAIIEVLIATGMRRAELIQMQLRDVRLEDRTLRVVGKRRKERIIPITRQLQKTLLEYMDYRRVLDTSENTLFLTNKLKPLYPKFVYNIVKRYLSIVTSAEGMGPHALRHTFATSMLDAGADINAIKELLGHADLNATQVYTHTSIEQLKAAYHTAHPKAGTSKN